MRFIAPLFALPLLASPTVTSSVITPVSGSDRSKKTGKRKSFSLSGPSSSILVPKKKGKGRATVTSVHDRESAAAFFGCEDDEDLEKDTASDEDVVSADEGLRIRASRRGGRFGRVHASASTKSRGAATKKRKRVVEEEEDDTEEEIEEELEEEIEEEIAATSISSSTVTNDIYPKFPPTHRWMRNGKLRVVEKKIIKEMQDIFKTITLQQILSAEDLFIPDDFSKTADLKKLRFGYAWDKSFSDAKSIDNYHAREFYVTGDMYVKNNRRRTLKRLTYRVNGDRDFNIVKTAKHVVGDLLMKCGWTTFKQAGRSGKTSVISTARSSSTSRQATTEGTSNMSSDAALSAAHAKKRAEQVKLEVAMDSSASFMDSNVSGLRFQTAEGLHGRMWSLFKYNAKDEKMRKIGSVLCDAKHNYDLKKGLLAAIELKKELIRDGGKKSSGNAVPSPRRQRRIVEEDDEEADERVESDDEEEESEDSEDTRTEAQKKKHNIFHLTPEQVDERAVELLGEHADVAGRTQYFKALHGNDAKAAANSPSSNRRRNGKEKKARYGAVLGPCFKVQFRTGEYKDGQYVASKGRYENFYFVHYEGDILKSLKAAIKRRKEMEKELGGGMKKRAKLMLANKVKKQRVLAEAKKSSSASGRRSSGRRSSSASASVTASSSISSGSSSAAATAPRRRTLRQRLSRTGQTAARITEILHHDEVDALLKEAEADGTYDGENDVVEFEGDYKGLLKKMNDLENKFCMIGVEPCIPCTAFRAKGTEGSKKSTEKILWNESFNILNYENSVFNALIAAWEFQKKKEIEYFGKRSHYGHSVATTKRCKLLRQFETAAGEGDLALSDDAQSQKFQDLVEQYGEVVTERGACQISDENQKVSIPGVQWRGATKAIQAKKRVDAGNESRRYQTKCFNISRFPLSDMEKCLLYALKWQRGEVDDYF